MSDIPFESPNKYGVFSDDLDELASRLSGTPIRTVKPSNSVHTERNECEVDADVLRSLLRDSNSKYGG